MYSEWIFWRDESPEDSLSWSDLSDAVKSISVKLTSSSSSSFSYPMILPDGNVVSSGGNGGGYARLFYQENEPEPPSKPKSLPFCRHGVITNGFCRKCLN